MGSSYGISCSQCDYSKNFIIGIGMMYSPNNIMDFDSEFALLPHLIRSKKTLEYIKYLINEKAAVIADDYCHEIYRCPKCGEFYERFFIHLDYQDSNYEVEYKCTKCKAVLKPIDYEVTKDDDEWEEKKINLNNYPCPKCGKYSLYEGGDFPIIKWD